VLKFLLAVADVAQVQIEKNEDLLVKTECLDGANVGKTQRTGNPVRKKIICRLRHVFELIVPKKKIISTSVYLNVCRKSYFLATVN
jgi:hypothetical protein